MIKMEISITAQPDFSTIPQISESLSEEAAHKLLEVSIQNISKLSPLQFLYITELATYYGKNRDHTFRLMKFFIESQPLRNLNILLQLEMHLASRVLKKFENQESYSKFYEIFNNFYKSKIGETNVIPHADASGVLFFVHSPVFLAHTNPLFHLLKYRNAQDKIAIASLSSNPDFSAECDRLGVKFIQLQGENTVAQLRHLEVCSADYKQVVWQCMPAYLSYFSARMPRINWWSFKFNPPISQIRKCITSLPSNQDIVRINDNDWHNFSPAFDLKNYGKAPVKWSEREGKIGAFCREELIDDEQYWAVLASVLGQNNKISFHYCGRKPIHERWVRRFTINPEQITFLGWLAHPNEAMRSVSVILDTFKIRHGLMGREAMAAHIPILYPHLDKNFGGLEDLYKRLPDDNDVVDPAQNFAFNSQEEASQKLLALALDEKQNNDAGSKQAHLINSFPEGNFEQFLALL
jgi:hypothetical protein